MAIAMTCPRCTHKNAFDDSKAGQQVHCRICHHPFALPGTAVQATTAAPKASTPSAPPQQPAAPGAVKQGPPRPEPRTDPDKRRPPDSRRGDRRDRDDDDDDDRDRGSRRRRQGSSSGVLFWVFGGIGAVLLLGCCGVVSIFVLGITLVEDRAGQIAAINDPAPIDFNPPPIVINPGGGNNPGIIINPPPPQAPPLDPRNAADGAEVLKRLKNNGPDVDAAYRWLREADLKHPLARDFARQLDTMVEHQKQVQPINGNFFEAYFRWANSADNFNSLMRMVQDNRFGGPPMQHRWKAIETLGRLKDARAADAIVTRMADVHDRNVAQNAIQAIGPPAQAALLKRMNDSDWGMRMAVADLLKRSGVTSDAMLTQALDDLKNGDEKVRNLATEWLSKQPVDDKRQAEVARALDGAISPQALQGHLLKALEVWGTKDNALTLSKNLDTGNVFKSTDAIKLLGKLKDPRTLPALANCITRPGLEAMAAKDALKKFGTAAEPEVIKLLMSPEQRIRHEACQLLADVGTAKVSGPAMQRAVNAYPQDRLLDLHAKTTWKRILARGG